MAVEELEFGPRPLPRHSRLRLLVVSLVAGALVLGGLIGWQLHRLSSPQFTLDDLSNSYAAFTTNNGSNNVSILRRSNFTEQPVEVSPEGCGPLVQPTIGSQFPATALDGVLVYSIGRGNDATTSLFTFRYADATAARKSFAQVEQGLRQCDRATVRRGQSPVQVLDLVEIPVESTGGLRHQTAYLMEVPAADYRLSVNLLHYGNTLSWLYRYETTRNEYSPKPAQDLMAALVTQMRDVRAASN